MTRFAMTPLTPAVAQKIEALFAPESREAAGRMIAERCGADLPLSTHMGPDPSGFDRIRFAVLKLSHGDLERLSREIDGAHFDWRDTLMAAGFGEDIHAHLEPLMTKSQEHGSLGEYDVVRVARLDAPSRDFSGTDGVSRPPRIGDEAIICHLYDSRDPKAPVAVEMVDSEGRTVWFADFLPDELELVSHTPR